MVADVVAPGLGVFGTRPVHTVPRTVPNTTWQPVRSGSFGVQVIACVE
jgi:hypothetical protein